MLRPAFVFLSVCSLWFSGCGSFSDAMCGPVDDHVFYRGVRFDFGAAKEGGANLLLLADLPFSAIVDTVLVPSLVYNQLTDSTHESCQSPTDEGGNGDMRKPISLPPLPPKE